MYARFNKSPAVRFVMICGHNWEELSRDDRAELVKALRGTFGSIREATEILSMGKSQVHRLLVYSGIPLRLREKYRFLSLNAFLRTLKGRGNLEDELENRDSNTMLKCGTRRSKSTMAYVQLAKFEDSD